MKRFYQFKVLRKYTFVRLRILSTGPTLTLKNVTGMSDISSRNIIFVRSLQVRMADDDSSGARSIILS
jgi:hypothetical protein